MHMTEQENIKKSISLGLKIFKDNVAEYTRIGDSFEVLDFRKPNTIHYSIRIVFDRKHGKAAYITGDMGEAIVYPTWDCTLESFVKNLTIRDNDGNIDVNESYFKEKICAINPNDGIVFYEVDDVKADLRDQFVKYGKEDLWNEFEEEYFDSFFTDVKVFPTFGVVFSDIAEEFLRNRVGMEAEDLYGLGERINPRIVFWLVAMRLAWEQLDQSKKQEKCK
jgi:hypothetical protein